MATNAARRLASLTRRLGQFDQVIVTTAGQIVYDALIDQLRRDTGGDQSLSGIGRGRYRLDVDITPLRNPAGVRLRPKAKQAGMWTLLDKGRPSGFVVTARPRRRHQRGVKRGSSWAAGMKIGGAWRAGPFTVKRGTRGHRTWSKGVDRGLADAIPAVRRKLHEVVAASV